MKRFHLMLDEDIMQFAKEEAERRGVPVGNIIRTWLKKYIRILKESEIEGIY